MLDVRRSPPTGLSHRPPFQITVPGGSSTGVPGSSRRVTVVAWIQQFCRGRGATLGRVTIQRMDNVGVVVDDLEAATAFFLELGTELEGEAAVEGPWVYGVVGLAGVRVDIAMIRTPDGHGRLELTKFHSPTAVHGESDAAPNTLGIRRIMFAVEDIEDVLTRLQAHGAEPIGGVEQYEDRYRFCYVRGPEGIIIAFAEQLS